MLTVGTKVKVNGCEGKIKYSFLQDGKRHYGIKFDNKDLIPPEMDVCEDNVVVATWKESPVMDEIKKDEKCYFHKWETVGHGPVSNIPWINCAKCGIRKEDYEK